MSIAFLDTEYIIDASSNTIGNSVLLKIPYNLHLTSIVGNVFVVTQYDIDNVTEITTNLPYTVMAMGNGSFPDFLFLNITFNQPISNIYFGLPRAIKIANNGISASILLTVNYANPVSSSNWGNASDSTTLTNILVHGGLTSNGINTILKSIYQTGLTGWSKVNNAIKKFSFNDKYLQDIIDLAISAGVSTDNSNSTITYNSDGNIATLITIYDNAFRSGRSKQLKLTYTYAPINTDRLQNRNGSYSILETKSSNQLSVLQIDALDVTGNIIFHIATVTMIRSLTVYKNPFLADYNASLANPLTDPNNLLSDYKYYQTPVITGWTVAV